MTGFLTCHCGTGVERTPNKSAHKVDSGEENSPAVPAGIRCVPSGTLSKSKCYVSICQLGAFGLIISIIRKHTWFDCQKIIGTGDI